MDPVARRQNNLVVRWASVAVMVLSVLLAQLAA